MGGTWGDEVVRLREERVETEHLISRYPVLYHMAENGSLESIRRLGLLSTSALLDVFEVRGERRFEIESRRRPESVEIRHPEHGRALVRDNKPMQEKALGRCLIGMEPTEWYETLNRRVFFWVDRRRLIRLLGARAYRDRPHLVLELNTEQLMRRHWWRVSLSGINSGATFSMNPASRGPGTFRRIADHPQNDPVVELTVDYAVLDTAELVFAVSRWRGAARLETIWERSA